jgi:hypothetical protein
MTPTDTTDTRNARRCGYALNPNAQLTASFVPFLPGCSAVASQGMMPLQERARRLTGEDKVRGSLAAMLECIHHDRRASAAPLESQGELLACFSERGVNVGASFE